MDTKTVNKLVLHERRCQRPPWTIYKLIIETDLCDTLHMTNNVDKAGSELENSIQSWPMCPGNFTAGCTSKNTASPVVLCSRYLQLSMRDIQLCTRSEV